jgi:hypothetical protein
MRFYFSGVEGKAELAMLREAGASRLLVDPTQLARLDGELDGFRLALDSGAYRLFKQNKPRHLAGYAYTVEEWQNRGYAFDFVTTLDDLGDRQRTWRDWLDLSLMLDCYVLPVWHYSQPEMIDLFLYWDKLAGTNLGIGVGGLVPYLFTDASKEAREQCRKFVGALCDSMAGRYRLFGSCDLPLLNAVKDTALSADSSFWLRGRRRGVGFYVNSKTGQLCQANKWLMEKLAPDYPEIAELLKMDGRERSVHNARLLEERFNKETRRGGRRDAPQKGV